MKRRILMGIAAIFSAVCLFVAVFTVPSLPQAENSTVIVEVAPAAQSVENEIEALPEATQDKTVGEKETETEIPLEKRLLSMLNVNYCYADAFLSDERMAVMSAITLNDYSTDIPGYGICVNKALIGGFAKSFYGVELDLDSIKTDCAPEGFVALPCYEVGSQSHEIVSITETENGYEVISTVTFYYSSYDVDVYSAVSLFIEDSESEFGFNLKSCSLE